MKDYIYFTLLGILIHFKNLIINPVGIMDYSISLNYLPEFLSIILLMISGGFYLLSKEKNAVIIGLIGFGLYFFDLINEYLELTLLKNSLQ